MVDPSGSRERPVVDNGLRPRHLAVALIALATGGFAIGTTEFVTMGLLPEIANGINQSIPTTSHIITAYALGVVVGAPVIVSMAAHLPKRELAVVLILAVGAGNGMTALASGYLPLLVARFIAGLPHGAYFGVAALIAASLVAPQMRGRAVGSVMLGLAVANILGVPASAWLGQQLGWRSAYWTVLAVAVIAGLLILRNVPHIPGDHTASIRRELTALLQPQVWFAFATGMVGFGGMFAMYSYIAPTITQITHLSAGWIPAVLLVFGFGAVSGTWLGGRGADWNLTKSIAGAMFALAVLLGLFVVGAAYPVSAMVLVFLIEVVASVLAITLTVKLMEASGEAQMLGAALVHSSLNIANGIGALLGSIVISAGFGYRAPSVVGAGLAMGGLLIFAVGVLHRRRQSGPTHFNPSGRWVSNRKIAE